MHNFITFDKLDILRNRLSPHKHLLVDSSGFLDSVLLIIN
jgi:hypothetical protein